MTTHDVIVAGAGPAGSAAAASLARRGHDILLLDRQTFPRDKTCGDGIPPGTISILDGLGMANVVREANFYEIHGIRLGSPWGRTWETTFKARRPGDEFYIAPRDRFDVLIRDHAVACGAAFTQASVKAPIIEDGRVCGVRVVIDGREKALRARVVIAADGATSVIARALHGDRQPLRMRGVALRGYMTGIETLPNKVEFYFDRELLPGYAWIFPLAGDRANVGVIMPADRFKKRGRPLRDYLDRFLRRRGIRERVDSAAGLVDVKTWQLPYAAPGAPARAFGGAMLAGDAGGFVDALTGEGIHHALVSSTIAADVAHEALVQGDTSLATLAAFDVRCDAELGRLIRRSWRLQRFVARFPLVLEGLFLAAGVGSGFVQSFINRVSSDFVAEG